jgi:hypothetical protein
MQMGQIRWMSIRREGDKPEKNSGEESVILDRVDIFPFLKRRISKAILSTDLRDG